MMDENGSILDFQHAFQKKQKESIEAVHVLFESFLEERDTTNIREKVRAKHAFCSLASIPQDRLLTSEWEQLFLDWLGFDYLNIYGITIFQQFLRKQGGAFPEQTLILCGLLMATVLEPVAVKEKHSDKEITCFSVFKGITKRLCSKERSFHSVKNNDVLLIRKIDIYNQSILIGNPHILSNAKVVIEKMKNDYRQYSRDNKSVTWRSFLKRSVVKYLDSGKAE
jgi:hypothetical protein